MTTAPENLKAVRTLLLTHLDFHENSSAYPGDLDPAEVGIVGDPNHRGGYHCGRDRVDLDDYSVDESPRDSTGLTDYASAVDVGQFSYGANNLRTFSVWLVSQCAAGTADTRDIREVIYSPDGTTVRRWDRLKRRSSGDSSHLWHTHISYHRDATKAGRDLTAVFRRYLTEIGLMAGEEPDMEQNEKLAGVTDNPNRTVGDVFADVANLRNGLISPPGAKLGTAPLVPAGSVLDLVTKAAQDAPKQRLLQEAILAKVTADDKDPTAIMAHVDQVAAALPKPPTADEIGDAVVDRLGAESPDSAAANLLAVLGRDRAAALAAALTAATQG